MEISVTWKYGALGNMGHGNMGHLEIRGTEKYGSLGWKYGSLGNMGYLEMGHLEIRLQSL